jgi:hypothetical protein
MAFNQKWRGVSILGATAESCGAQRVIKDFNVVVQHFFQD